MLIISTGLRFGIEQYFHNCMVHGVVGRIFGFFYILLTFWSFIINGSVHLPLNNQAPLYLIFLVISVVLWLHTLNKSKMEHMRYLHEIYKNILAKSESSYIVDRLEESIVIVN